MAHPSNQPDQASKKTQSNDNQQANEHEGAADAPFASPSHAAITSHSPAIQTIDHSEPEKQRFSSLLLSLLAGAIGVQSSANREKDFRQGRVLTYIIAGSIGTILFIAGLVSLVQFILKNAS